MYHKNKFRKQAFVGTVLFLAVSATGLTDEQSLDDPFAGAPSSLELGPGETMPEVLSATRLRQPKSKVPGTVTILRGELLRQLGTPNLWEVFRLVPGMTVGYVESNTPIVSYHGTAANEQRRLQVLVDGRSVYNASLADVDWHNIPVPLESIDRIEVTRGPNAAAYGVNSYLAIINIITKNPQDTHGIRAKGATGSRGYESHYASVGNGNDLVDWRLSYSRQESDGFDYRFFNTGNESEGETQKFDDSFGFNTLNLSTVWRLGQQDSVEVLAGSHRGYDETDREEFPGYGLIVDPELESNDWYGQVKWNHQISDQFEFYLQYYHTQQDRNEPWTNAFSLDTALNLAGLKDSFTEQNFYTHPSDLCTRAARDPSLLVSQEPPVAVCVETNENIREERDDVEFQGTAQINEDLKFVSGASYREDRAESETFFGGERTNYITRVFANVEYSPFHWVTTNIGAMWEDDNDNGNFVSPRYALNFHLTSNQTVRFVWSKAYRTPDALEESADWKYPFEQVTIAPLDPELVTQTQEILEAERGSPVSYAEAELTLQAVLNGFKDLEGNRIDVAEQPSPIPRGLEPEQIISREVSYYGLFRIPAGSLSLEVKAFHDSLSNHISGVLSATQTQDLENNINHTQEGIEIESMLEMPDDTFRLTYAFLDPDSRYFGSKSNPNRYFRLESRLSAQHSGSLSWIHRFPGQITTAGTFYYAEQAHYVGQDATWKYERLDVRAAKTFLFTQSLLEVSGTVQYYPSSTYVTNEDNNFEDDTHFIVAADFRF